MSRCNCSSQCLVDDNTAKKIEMEWKSLFPSASLLPVIGLPSNSGGVGTLIHLADFKGMKVKPMDINQLPCKSALANAALYSFECSKGYYVNLYEIMLPDIPGFPGELSSTQLYVNKLRDLGMDVNGFHFHWTGGTHNMNGKDYPPFSNWNASSPLYTKNFRSTKLFL